MSEIKQQGKYYLVQSQHGTYSFNNKKTAEQLNKQLNTYEKQHKLNNNIEQQHDKITRQIIQLKLTIGTLNEEIQTLEEQIQCLSK